MATVEQSHEEPRVLLQGVAWKTYDDLRESPANRSVRMTYDRGELEILSPSKSRERCAYLIGRLIDVWTEELSIDIQSCRTMTCRREDLDRGLEPDNCYYVRHERRMRRKTELDLAIDPPPDLAIEVEISRPAIDKMPIYVTFGVPELWRCDGETLQVFELVASGKYESRDGSVCFPRFPIAQAVEILRKVHTASETALVRSFRQRVRENAVEH
jgi:Uma2 family endonuclease